MKRVDQLRNEIINKILAIRNADFLEALDHLLTSTKTGDLIALTEEQKLMLQMSDLDISNGRTYTQDEIDTQDSEWLGED